MNTPSFKYYLCAAVVLVFGLVFISQVWSARRRHIDILEHGGETTAVVWDRNASSRGNMDFLSDYHLEVRYRLDNHTQRACVRITSDAYERCAYLKKVPIRYLPDRPGQALMVGDGDPLLPRHLEASGVLVVALVLGLLGRRAAAG